MRSPITSEEVNEGRPKVGIGPDHVYRLYDAYRSRLKDEGDDSKGAVKLELKEKESPPLQRDITSITKKYNVRIDKANECTPIPIIKYDATDDQAIPAAKCLARLPSRSRENQTVKAKVEPKTPLVGSMILVKLNVPENMLKVKKPEKIEDPGERQILELIRIYQKFLKAWQQPTPSVISKNESPGNALASYGSVRLSALSDLLDVVERLQQGDLVKELAEKINQEMEPNLQKQIKQDALLVTESRESLRAIKKNDLSGIFDNVEPGSASRAFKNMLDDINSRRSTIKAGGLYDEYKKGFCQLFSNHKFPRQSLITSETGYPVDSESSSRMNVEDILPCQGNKTIDTPLTKHESKCQTPAKKYVSMASPTTNSNYLKALENFLKINKEGNKNGGLKPYYLPHSKNRQLIWNDIPLIKPGLSETPKKTSEDKLNNKPSSTPIQEIVVPEKEPIKAPSGSKPAPNLLTKVPKMQNPLQEVFSGLDPKQIITGLKAIKQSSFFNLVDEYQKQIDNLNQALKNKQSWWKEVMNRGKAPMRTPSKRNIMMNNPPTGPALPVPFPEVLVNQAPLGGNNVIGNMASQMNLSPLEMAQRIVGAGQNAAHNPGNGQVRFMPIINPLKASQIGSNFKKVPEVPGSISQQWQEEQGISPVLDKILERLETIQATKCNKTAVEEEEKNLPCCFVDPADGSPCDLNGSWESLVLGIRINIRSPPMNNGEAHDKPTCSQHKNRNHRRRFVRQCVKMNKTQLKEMSDTKNSSYQGITLNITVQETVPPRAHDLLDNLTDWYFSGHTLMILGGPLSLSFRKANSNLIGHFVGYCRTCGCVDTIFGSWSFCQPSRDCQDICMSIVDRRDMLRRYSMDERRKNRFKEQLYMGSKFAKNEKQQLVVEQAKFNKQRSQDSQNPNYGKT
ncbi:uncharacterized protein LOC108109414 [Drosophila eugracilis]|uniref:uncharacterized protein LOC108109414 n=1 Tax=Drosophila eugracilis TaxID=29029 RepID=UPI001BD96966|nr:uncharacterized protein LOC108109414 [Drosophila eugracilis]